MEGGDSGEEFGMGVSRRQKSVVRSQKSDKPYAPLTSDLCLLPSSAPGSLPQLLPPFLSVARFSTSGRQLHSRADFLDLPTGQRCERLRFLVPPRGQLFEITLRRIALRFALPRMPQHV